MLLRELVHIPEQIHASDFVLKLSEGFRDPERTVREYVCTDDLEKALGKGLDLVQHALESKVSYAAFLHGSFGSGKSHWMAILSLLLERNPALSLNPRLQALAGARSRSALEGRKILMVPFHLIGAKSLQEAILEGYAKFVGVRHPDAPVPAVYRSDELLTNARALRDALGDDAFLAKLNEAASSSEGWGDLDTSWTSERLDAAWSSPPWSDEHAELVSALVREGGLLSSFRRSDNNLVSLDDGLQAICRHAQGLGYDALVLFLDELVLWLLSHSADSNFVRREGEQLVKLVENQNAQRPIPLVSLIARQRDLGNILGQDVQGSQRLDFREILDHQMGRFNLIELSNTDLPQIVQERILRPLSDTAREAIDLAFAKSQNELRKLVHILLGADGTIDQFRKLYPFHPALVEALVSLSEALQRDRTTLRSLLQLLVDRRQDLSLGDLVPVGDLWNVICDNEPPQSSPLSGQFRLARQLYASELWPLLLETNGFPPDWDGRDASLDAAWVDKLPKLRGEERLLKTILLASLVPGVKAFTPLNAERLLALNHGCISTLLPGQDRVKVVALLRTWAERNGKIRLLGDQQNPTVSVQLVDIDVNVILDSVAREDSQDARIQAVQDALFRQLGIDASQGLEGFSHKVLWRGVRWPVQIRYQNVRNCPGPQLAPSGRDWLVVIDYPFDDVGFTPQDDLRRLGQLSKPDGGLKTLCWLPDFFSSNELESLGRLIRVRYLLRSDRMLEDHTPQLTPAQRSQAKTILDTLRNSLEQVLVNAVARVYGIGEKAAATSHAESHFVSLWDALPLRMPNKAVLSEALEDLVHQALAFEHPRHPHFEIELDERKLRAVATAVGKAMSVPERRLQVHDPSERLWLAQIAMPLRLGVMHEQYFQAHDEWYLPLERALAPHAKGAIKVRQVFDAINADGQTGLGPLPLKLLTWLYAQRSGRGFVAGGQSWPVPDFKGVEDHLELRPQRLLDGHLWDLASRRAGALLGIPQVSPLHNAQSQTTLASEIRKKLGESQALVVRDHDALQEFLERLGESLGSTVRGKAQRVARNLVQTIDRQLGEEGLLESFAEADLENVSELIVSVALKGVGGRRPLHEALSQFPMSLLESLLGRTDAFGDQARALRTDLLAGLSRPETDEPFEPLLQKATQRLQALLQRTIEVPRPVLPPAEPPPPQQPVPPTSRIVDVDPGRPQVLEDALRELRAAHPGKSLRVRIDVIDP